MNIGKTALKAMRPIIPNTSFNLQCIYKEMGQYFIKVSSEYRELDRFLQKCDPFGDTVIVQIDSFGTETPKIVVTLDKYPWVKKTFTHITGHYYEYRGYQTVDLSPLVSGDSSNTWAEGAFGTPWPSPIRAPSHPHDPYMTPTEIPFSPRDQLTDSLP